MSANLITVTGTVGQRKFWRYWLVANLANAATVFALAAAALLAYRVVLG